MIIFFSFRKFKKVRSRELIAKISLSYIPKIKAKVPPDIPGIISAMPIAMPLKNSAVFCIADFMKPLPLTKEQKEHLQEFPLQIDPCLFFSQE